MPSTTDERAALPFGEVTQPFGLKLDLAAIASESDPTAEDASAGQHADVPTQDAPAPRKARGFVVAEHGELLTTPAAPVASLDAPEPAAHGGAPAPSVETPEFTTRPVAPMPRAPIELDDLSGASDEPMQLASTWEFVGWQGGDDTGPIGHVPETTWADRGVDLDGPALSPAATEVPLASAWDFIQQPWQPTAAEPSDVITTLLAAAASAATEGPMGGPSVTAEHVLSALDVVNTQGVLGRVVLAYCAGRFQRAFLLGESLGLARVGHAWGPGSDSAAVAQLKVDLEAPSLLHTAMTSAGASVFDAPACPQDEAIFAALGGEGASHRPSSPSGAGARRWRSSSRTTARSPSPRPRSMNSPSSRRRPPRPSPVSPPGAPEREPEEGRRKKGSGARCSGALFTSRTARRAQLQPLVAPQLLHL
ncbi:general secretion pathway protein GspE [Myxococcus sp. MxC21-1]|uniref:hypothetical protein n=1 Tax=Myxococcus sp. MxC21-1 TaxID=3041439 RepID=UPI00292CFE61|nr:hypothetical protein [Myxococcus sp. MxC21-1]WNZ64946.1 general secretion pathway protein GspE [Myxococcus sp. MxC21-1]